VHIRNKMLRACNDSGPAVLRHTMRRYRAEELEGLLGPDDQSWSTLP
jgi:hypothetical protein